MISANVVFSLFISLNMTLAWSDILIEGDVTIAGVFDIQTESEGQCGHINIPSVMMVEGVRWYLNNVNNDGTLPFKLGLRVFKTCGNIGTAAEHAVDIVSRYSQAKVTNSSEDFIVGLLGPTFSSEAQVMSSILGSQPQSERLLQLGFSSTSTILNDREKYPNFYRVIPEDSVQITTMIELMKSMEWNRIAVIYDNDTYGSIGAKSLQEASIVNNICISKMYPITIDASRHVDIKQIRGIIDTLVVKSPTIQGVVFFGTRSVANKILQIVNNLDFIDVPIFILSEAINLQTDVFKSAGGNILSKTKGSLVVSAPYSEVSDFREFWNSLFIDVDRLSAEARTNPLLADVFLSFSGCDVRTETCQPMTDAQVNEKIPIQPVYVKYAIFAAHTLVEALRKVKDSTCPGSCDSADAFKENFEPSQLLQAVDGLSVSYNGMTISFNEDSPNARLAQNAKSYEVYNFRKTESGNDFGLVNVGYLMNEELTLETYKIKDYNIDGLETTYPDVRKGQCPVQQKCEECMLDDLAEVDFHIPGDLYVVGIISVNNRALTSPQGCGTVRTRHGYQMYLTMEFVLEEFRTRSWYDQYVTKFAGNTIGLVVINSCNNAIEVVRKILNLHSKGLKLPNGEYLDLTNRVLGYVGGQSTDVSEPAARQLTELQFVQISYSSTNPILSDIQKYPYFLRIITPDNVQAKAMIDIVKELKGEYIQIVYSEGAYGEGGHESVVALTKKAGICIAQEILVRESDRYYEHYQTLQKKSHAKLVIIFLRSHVVGPFMRDMDELMTRGEFQFIGSEAWGKNGEMLTYDIDKGSITLAVEMDKNTYLEEYLKEQTPTFNDTNPWLEEYIQKRQDCYFEWSFDKKYSRPCMDDILPKRDNDFESDPWCIFVFNSMISLLKGAADFFDRKCGNLAGKLCPDYVQDPESFVEVLKNVKIDIYGNGDILVYDSHGDGLMGYKVYNIKDNPEKTKRVYSQIGSYSLSDGLQFQKNRVTFPTDNEIQSTCPSEHACQACRPEAEPSEPKQDSDPTIPAMGGVIGILVVIIVILIIIMVIKLRKKGRDSTYLTPASMHGMSLQVEERQIGEGKHHSDEEFHNDTMENV